MVMSTNIIPLEQGSVGVSPNGLIPLGLVPIPLIYGESPVQGVLIAEGNMDNTDLTRIYAFCEGEVDSITRVSVNGNTVDTTQVHAYQERLGTAGQSLQEDDFGGASWAWSLPTGNIYYHPRLVYICIRDHTDWGATINTVTVYNRDAFRSLFQKKMYGSGTPNDAVGAVIKGLKVQKYLADGTPDGALAWSDNPVWCLLDFILVRSSKPLASSLIDFSYWKVAADLCDTNDYRIQMTINEQKNDADIIELMLRACRGYFSYPAGKMAINIEQKWSGAVAHVFGDSTTVQDNLTKFKYYKRAVNEVYNRVIVKYIDSEIRDNMALIDGYLDKSVTTIPYGDLKGTFAASGTIYIAEEAITYTGNTGTSLTGCAARTRDYPSGYPLFQGAQVFPEMTAVYNDYTHQDEVGRVIEQEIDGSTIPTYRQAYAIAEWLCRKSVRGNQYCSFQGFMDSLHLTVGDVVEITHSLPGWVSQKFRVLTASESKDEEVDYECEYYDDAFYAQNSIMPPARIVSSLPDPYAVLGNVSSLALAESGYTGADGTYVPILTLTYNLPTESRTWGKALIQVKVGAGDYVSYGMDNSRGEGFVIDGLAAQFAPGDTVTVRVVSINISGVISDTTTSPTTSAGLTGSVVDPTTPTGLALEGGGTTWNGLKFAAVWDPPAAGAEPSYIFAEVEVWTGGVKRATFGPIKENRWDYVYGDGIAAFLDNYVVAANGAVTIKVCKKNVYGAVSTQATLSVTQAAPANPQNAVIQALPRGAVLSWDKNTESDFKEYQVRTKVTSGGTWSSFIPIAENSFTRMLTSTEIGSYGKTPAIYFEVKTLDLFGNASSATAANVAAIYYGITNLDVDDLSADKITAGSIRGINVQAGSFMTKGSYLTSAPAGGATTLDVKDTTDFPTSGSGWIIDTTNDRDAISWTGKTATTLTGCSGVLAHNNGATIIPAVKDILIDAATNEMRFFGDRGDGTIEELGNIGIKQDGSDYIIALFGSIASGYSRVGVLGKSNTNVGVAGYSDSYYGLFGWSSTGAGLSGYGDVGGYGVVARCADPNGLSPLVLVPSGSASAPTHSALKGSTWVTSAGILYINTDGSTTWGKVGAQ